MNQIKEKLKQFLYPWVQRLRKSKYLLLFLLFRPLKIREKDVLMFSRVRKELSGNLLFIYNEIKRQQLDLHVHVVLQEEAKDQVGLSKLLATCKYVLIDDFEPIVYVLPFRKKQKLVQVWHAMGAFKRVGFSRAGTIESANSRSLTHRNYTDTIVSSGAIRPCYAEAFGISLDKIHAFGIPRTDAFFDEKQMQLEKEKLYERYPQLKEKKVILFAPTFRGKGKKEAHYPNSYLKIEEWHKQLGDEYLLVLKLHPFIQQDPYIPEGCEDFVLNLSAEREINHLLFVTDVLVTDYSSVIFENALLKIPCVFYAPDYDAYCKDRGFYFDYEEYRYGALARNTEELVKAIRAGYVDEERLETFREKFIENCDGHASERFVDQILKD